MSIMSEYTIETAMTKDEVIKKLKMNVGYRAKGLASLVSAANTDLPFYGKVEEDEFKIHLNYKHYSTHLMMALEGSVEEGYDTTKIHVRPKGMSGLMIYSTITTPIVMAATMYAAVTYGNLPINLMLPPFSVVAVLSIIMMFSYTRYYVHKAKKAFQELFTR